LEFIDATESVVGGRTLEIAKGFMDEERPDIEVLI
jgi:hypothetical protein